MKNGFTLVELLAVIVILAIIALIATPIVLSIIDDTKKSSMLRSAEMYLSGVENAVMRENMNTGGNYRPNDCTITNGLVKCDDYEGIAVEVDGEVPQDGSTIKFENGKIKQVTLNYTSGTIIKDESGSLVYEEEGNEYTAYSIGDEVTIGDENFYVISDDTEKVTLLAKDCIDPVTLVQSANAASVSPSGTEYWEKNNGITYPYDLNDTATLDGITIIIKAREYGTNLGGIGRLMTKEEAEVLELANSDILYGTNGKSSSDYLDYWLSTAYSAYRVWYVLGSNVNDVHYSCENFIFGVVNGVRPIVEISKDKLF